MREGLAIVVYSFSSFFMRPSGSRPFHANLARKNEAIVVHGNAASRQKSRRKRKHVSPMAALLDALLDESVDDEASLLSCVFSCCGPASLLALARCSERLRQAVAAPLHQAERVSAAMVCDHIGATLEQLAAGSTVTWHAGLPRAQCRHLGAWLQPGAPLEGVAKLRLQKGNNKVVRINLARLRSGASQWDLTDQGVDDELMTVLAMPIAVNASLNTLWCARFLTKPS